MNRRKTVHTLLTAGSAVLVVVVIAAMWIGSGRSPEPPSTTEPPPDAEMKLSDMEYTEMQGGRRLWTLKSDEARYFQGMQKSSLNSVHVTFFLENGDEIFLKSREGILYAGSKNIELWNEVRADLPKGYALETDRAFYDHEQKVIHADTPVHLTGPDIDLTGQRWIFKIPERTYILEGGVTATVLPNPPKEGTNE